METPHDPNAKPGQRGYNGPHYVSPFGKADGLGERLLEHARVLGTDKSLPWVGLGLIDDLRKAAEMLGVDPGKLPLGEARAEVFAQLASANGPTGQRAPVPAPTPAPALEYDL